MLFRSIGPWRRTGRPISPRLVGPQTRSARTARATSSPRSARDCGYGSDLQHRARRRRTTTRSGSAPTTASCSVTRDAGRSWRDVTPPGVPAWAKIATVDVSALGAAARPTSPSTTIARTISRRTPAAHATTAQRGPRSRTDCPRGHFVGVVRADPPAGGCSTPAPIAACSCLVRRRRSLAVAATQPPDA